MTDLPNKLITIIASLSFFLFFSNLLYAQEKITIAVGNWPPYISQDQEHNGVISHLISDIFDDIGIEISIEFLPWSRAYNETKNGRYAATAIWMEKDERKNDFLYSNEVLSEQFVFFHTKGLPFNWKTIDDLKPYKIGGIQAYSYGPALDKLIANNLVQIEYVNRPQQNFWKLLKDRIDVFPIEINVAKSILNKHFTKAQRQEITYNIKPLLNNSSFLLFPKSLASSKELLVTFNQHLQKFKDDGRYDTYFENLKNGVYDKISAEPMISDVLAR